MYSPPRVLVDSRLVSKCKYDFVTIPFFPRAADGLNGGQTERHLSWKTSSIETDLLRGLSRRSRRSRTGTLHQERCWQKISRSEEHTSELQSPDHLVCR